MPKHRYKILDGFSIVDSGVEGQPIHSIETEITASAVDTALPTEKAVKDYVDVQNRYLGAFDSRNRPQDARTGDYILDTDLGFIIYRYGDAWINPTGTVLEGNVEPSVNYPVRWMENPMSASGDLIVGGASGVSDVLPVGSEGQVLTVVSNEPAWANPSGGGGGSAWSEVLPPTNITYGSGTFYGVARLFEPGADVVRSLCIWSAGFQRDKDTRGSIAIYRTSVASGSTVLLTSGLLSMTRIAYRKFKVKANGFCHWYDFAADVDVSDKSYIYAYAISFEMYYGPMSSFKLMCSSYSAAAASQKAYVEKMLGDDSLIGNTLSFSLDDSRYQYSIASGVSSVPRQTETEVP